jgi:hypothetical protein
VISVVGLLLSAAFAVVVYVVVRGRELDTDLRRLDTYCATLGTSVQQTLLTSERTLSQYESLVSTFPDITNADFAAYTSFAAQDFEASAVSAGGYGFFVRDANRTAYERKWNVTISEGPLPSRLVPRSRAPFYLPTTLYLPQFRGWDMCMYPSPCSCHVQCAACDDLMF